MDFLKIWRLRNFAKRVILVYLRKNNNYFLFSLVNDTKLNQKKITTRF